MTSSKSQQAPFARIVLSALAAAACALAVSCGGGGGSNNSNMAGGTTAQQVASCDRGQPQSQITPPTTGNSVPVMIDSGPCAYGVPFGSPSGTSALVYVVNSANVPYTSVTICTPGTTSCQTIDHILVDTGSTGLRLMSSVLSSAVTLPAITVGGAPLIECVQFADGYSWGSMRQADVHIAGETAANIPVQVVGDSSAYTVPASCTGTSVTPLGPLNDVSSFGANGVLGVGLFDQDCGTGCVGNPSVGFYYACPTVASCAGSVAALNQQTTNPVFAFAADANGVADNNGVVLQFPALAPATGASNVRGTLTFGINTRGNNSAATASVNTYVADGYGDFFSTITTISTSSYTITATPYGNSFIDSGSNGIYIPGTDIPGDTTTHWFTPTVAASNGLPADVIILGARQQGSLGGGYNTSGVMTSVPTGPINTFTFEIANANTVLFPSGTGNNNTFNGLSAASKGGTSETGGIDWGLPFFLGKTIYIGLELQPITVAGTAQTGPFWAY